MKTFKDVAHLYTELFVKIKGQQRIARIEYYVFKNKVFIIDHQAKGDLLDKERVTPILRPLSDMTEEEQKEYDTLKVFKLATLAHKIGVYVDTPESFAYLLSRRFNLFDPNWEWSIDATTLNPNPYA